MVKNFSRIFKFVLIIVVVLTFGGATYKQMALKYDRNGNKYTYDYYGYVYTGSAGYGRREMFDSADNYELFRCYEGGCHPDGSYGTLIPNNQYTTCYEYDLPPSGGTSDLRYAKIKHFHRDGTISNKNCYFAINAASNIGVELYRDTSPPTAPQVKYNSNWQANNADISFYGAVDRGMVIKQSDISPVNTGSGVHHFEYSINNSAWQGTPQNDFSTTVTQHGVNTVKVRTADGNENVSAQTTVTVLIDKIKPNPPSIRVSHANWTNQNVSVTLRNNGDKGSGVKKVEYYDDSKWKTSNGTLQFKSHGIYTVQARVVDNVNHVSTTSTQQIYIDKLSPIIQNVRQNLNAIKSNITIQADISDKASGVYGVALTTRNNAPSKASFRKDIPTIKNNGIYYLWAMDNAGNISSSTKITCDEIENIVDDETVISDVEYRVNTEVITSVTLSSDIDRTTKNPAYAKFTINGRTYTHNNIYIPSGGTQLAWIRWKTSEEESDIEISITSNVEISTSIITASIVDLSNNTPPNPEADDRNDNFIIPNIPTSENNTSLSWGEWDCYWKDDFVWYEDWEWTEDVIWQENIEWQNNWVWISEWRWVGSYTNGSWVDYGKWVDQGWYFDNGKWIDGGIWVDNGEWENEGEYIFDWIPYSATLTANMEIISDEKNPTATNDTSKSGYGINQKVTYNIQTNQHTAVTKTANAISYFPEYKYQTFWRMLEKMGSSSSFEFKQNHYSTYNNRTHFLPIWYPNGTYTVYSKLIDIWTPAGMLSTELIDSININGNLWEDWYIRKIKVE